MKYALTAERGSRYGWGGDTGGAVAGMVTLVWLEDELNWEYEEGRDEDMAGVDGVECGVFGRLALGMGYCTLGVDIVW